MKGPPQERSQIMQRVRVGMTGLALVVVLMLVASALFRLAHDEAPVSVVGAPNADAVAGITGGNTVAPPDEPLAELGIAPAASDGNQAEPAPLPSSAR